MKQKQFFLMMLLAMLPWLAGARTVWTGSQELDWNNSKYVQINTATLGSVSANDYIVVKYTAETFAQMNIVGVSSGWATLQHYNLTASDTNTWMQVTSDMLEKMTGGIAVSGINMTVTSIEVLDGSDYANSVWVGEKVMPSNWGVWQTVDKSAFSAAQTGYLLRVQIRDLGISPQMTLYYTDGTWTVMPGTTSAASVAGRYHQYTITSEMLSKLQTYGLIVSGANYTLTAVDIIDPATLQTLTLSVPVTHNWVWAGGANPSITIHAVNDHAETVTAKAEIEVATDKGIAYTTVSKSVSLAANSEEDITLDFEADPGFYKVTAFVNNDLARAFNIGVRSHRIESAPDKQSDFDSFWQTAKTQLADVEASDSPTLTEITAKSTSARKVYLVEFQSVPDGLTGTPVTVRGYYCEPTDGQKHPVIMHYLGYDSGYRPGGESSTPYCPSGDANPGYAEFYLSTRGQSINNRPATDRNDGIERDFTNAYGDWFAFNFGNKDTYYYRGAYMDCVRAIDFMASRSTSDMDNLFAEGQSQGGAFTYAAAALSGRTFKAIAPAIPFMGDFPDYFQVGNWPASVARKNQGTMTDSEMYAFLSYFDTKNLATMVHCPVITSIGLQDNVCPPHTNIAPYNNLPDGVQKKIYYNAELYHQTASTWNSDLMSFFKQAQEDNFLKDNEEYLNTEEVVFPNWSTAYTFPTAIVASLKAGDKITVTVTDKGGNQWAQMNFDSNSADAHPLYNTKLYNMGDCPLDIPFTIDEENLPILQTTNNFILKGTEGVTITKVKLTRYVADPDYETMDVAVNLWTGEQTMADSWAGYTTISASQVANVQAGDRIRVSVSRISDSSVNPLIAFSNGNWGNLLDGYLSLSSMTAPTTYTLTLTDELAKTLRGEMDGIKGGLYIGGRGYDMTSVDLITTQQMVPVSALDPENAIINLWSGEQRIDNASATKTYQTVEKNAFSSATAGMKLRMTFKNLELGGTGRILHAWKAFTGINNSTLNTDATNYYEYTLTDDMITSLQTDGLRVTGKGYTLTSIDLIDPTKTYNIVGQFETADIKAWEPGESPNISVTLTNTHPDAVTIPLYVELRTDIFADYNTHTENVTLQGGETKTIDVPLTINDAGFYRMAVNANNEKVFCYYIGYDPTSIVSPDDAQPDFWEFWDGWKNKLAAIPIDATMTLIDDSGARNVYEVKYQSVPDTDGGEPVYIYGYYAEPKAAGTYPCRINFHGTDSGTGTPSVPGTDSNTDWCEFNFSARGQMLNRVKLGQTYGTDFYGYELGSNEKHYYRMVYLDTRRAVDFVYSQAKVNKNAIFAVGGSQGGCLTYVCAGLSDGRVKAIAPSITGHADFPHTMEIVTWPTNVFNNWINAAVEAGTYANYEEGKVALLRHQSYFDTKNFASRITSAVITNFSLQDHTDGPHLNISPYNLLTKVADADKHYIINQFLGHGTFSGWEDTYMTFFNQYIDKEVVNVSNATYATYYNSTATQLPAGVQAATIDDANSSTNTLNINWRYDGDGANNVIPGGTAVMLKSETGNYRLTLLPENTDEAPTGNLLHGSDVRTTTTGGDKYYKLAYGKKSSANEHVVGWYYGAEDGAAFTIEGGKAWLALSSTTARNADFFTLDDGFSTMIETVSRERAGNNYYYSLSGQRVTQPTKGLYIVNGKKVIIK